MSTTRGKPQLTDTQRRRVEQARKVAEMGPADVAAEYGHGIIDLENLAMVHGYVLGVTRAQVRELLAIIDELAADSDDAGIRSNR